MLSNQQTNLFLHIPAICLGFTTLGEIFAYVIFFFFKSNHWGSHIPSSRMVHAGCVFVAGIHPSRTWMSGSFETVWWNACMHRLDVGLYSHLKVWGNGVWTHVNPKGKFPSTGKIRLRGGSNSQRCIKQDSEPNTRPMSYPGHHTVINPHNPQPNHTHNLKTGTIYTAWPDAILLGQH